MPDTVKRRTRPSVPTTWEFWPDADSRPSCLTGLLVVQSRVNVWYRVQELPIPLNMDFEGRLFALSKLWGGTDRTVKQYEVWIDTTGRPELSNCNCRGFYSKAHCKHLLVMNQLIEQHGGAGPVG